MTTFPATVRPYCITDGRGNIWFSCDWLARKGDSEPEEISISQKQVGKRWRLTLRHPTIDRGVVEKRKWFPRAMSAEERQYIVCRVLKAYRRACELRLSRHSCPASLNKAVEKSFFPETTNGQMAFTAWLARMGSILGWELIPHAAKELFTSEKLHTAFADFWRRWQERGEWKRGTYHAIDVLLWSHWKEVSAMKNLPAVHRFACAKLNDQIAGTEGRFRKHIEREFQISFAKPGHPTKG